jgi:hypothetical protein
LIGDEVHHIHPLFLGGSDTLENMATLCTFCHESAPEEPERFLAYQRRGGVHVGTWAPWSHEERARWFFRLPWEARFQDAPAAWDWQEARADWEERLGYVNTERRPESAEVSSLKAAIRELQRLKDPDLESAIQAKRRRLKLLVDP